MPKISIITASYNSCRFIASCYQSIAAQTFTDWEWIVIDDFSSDGSVEALAQISELDSRIKLIRNIKNRGPGASRNIGIDNATGDYITFLDIDDGIFPYKLQKQINFMKDNDAEFSFHYYVKRLSDGMLGKKTIGAPSIVTRKVLLRSNFICNSTVMLRRDAVGSVRYPSSTNYAEDYIFWLKLLEKIPKAYCIPEILGWYRVGNTGSLSSSKIKMASNQWEIYRKHLGLNIFQSTVYFLFYAIIGLYKHLRK